MNRLKDLERIGQSVWLDTLARGMIESGELSRLIETDGIAGMTSNPAIFEKAITSGKEYDEDIARAVAAGEDVGTIYRRLAVHDIQGAADALRPVHDQTKGQDGFISLEVSPYLADDTQGTIEEALSLAAEIDRPNLMIKVPGTKAGIPAVRALTARGLNINVTLLFSCETYGEVARAYLEGLEALPADADLSRAASVASFFVSRIDTKVDALIDQLLEVSTKPDALAALRGKVAVANAKLAYQLYKTIFSGPRWEKLAARGARPQRLLWASTSTKNKAYPDVLYVDTLIGPDTVNTMPPETLAAFRDHGTVAATIEDDIEEAKATLKALADNGISLDAVTEDLVEDGVAKFAEASDRLYAALACKRLKLLDSAVAQVSEALGPAADAVKKKIAEWTKAGGGRRLWARDATLWTDSGEANWLGWLDIVGQEQANQNQLVKFRDAIGHAHLTDVVLLGMGGSSLGAAVLSDSFGHREGWPQLHILDSTDPDQIKAVEDKITVPTTLFIVCSKSGSTLEPNLLKDYFWNRALRATDARRAGAAFVAVTDPGSSMEAVARENHFAEIFHGAPAIGGRYSVLSKFGLVPGAALGLDLARFLGETQRMVTSCGPLVPPVANPGVRLGLTLGTLATECGRDKITIVASDALETMGTWLEQLIAESTGKQGKGLIPVDREPLGTPEAYGEDRVFVHLRQAGVGDTEGIKALEDHGHPVIRIVIEDSFQLGQIFFMWEIAVAVAGAVMGINPFDQPDVESAKVETRELTATYEKTGELPQEAPFFEAGGLALYADAANRSALGTRNSIAAYLKAHLARLNAHDYFAFLAFIEQCADNDAPFQTMREALRNAKKNATCLGFGPRFLHSTGQAYKGGPDTGVFLVVTCEHQDVLEIPGHKLSFDAVERAQALGDFAVLNERGRRALRVHLKEVNAGLQALRTAFEQALR
ncbi:MAG: bifunctional transaldolase/phosoglucose isomerase [Alphaproteobacteria bacterium]|nr:bifunctional transaldolase/phosoglucose isomerase [Alphaproteobacteria bacterium]MDE2073880.1 bifunctional transaldolase/phosoglucose isomerase [Alphaproteobacteria bacterium]MDE2351384.1 bifunctional transaldolase/phosoglucose isomerase [Alphaproteobacteria bacterium]